VIGLCRHARRGRKCGCVWGAEIAEDPQVQALAHERVQDAEEAERETRMIALLEAEAMREETLVPVWVYAFNALPAVRAALRDVRSRMAALRG
jgi:hypothetical protein